MADGLGELAHLAGELLRHGPHDHHALHFLRAALLADAGGHAGQPPAGHFQTEPHAGLPVLRRGLAGLDLHRRTMLLLSIQLIPSPLNSFYWWNGACYYTFTYGVGLLYLDAFANVLLRPERPR